jgi:hypothetical protein
MQKRSQLLEKKEFPVKYLYYKIHEDDISNIINESTEKNHLYITLLQNFIHKYNAVDVTRGKCYNTPCIKGLAFYNKNLNIEDFKYNFYEHETRRKNGKILYEYLPISKNAKKEIDTINNHFYFIDQEILNYLSCNYTVKFSDTNSYYNVSSSAEQLIDGTGIWRIMIPVKTKEIRNLKIDNRLKEIPFQDLFI